MFIIHVLYLMMSQADAIYNLNVSVSGVKSDIERTLGLQAKVEPRNINNLCSSLNHSVQIGWFIM